jgi:hypothetical protein
VTRVNSNLTQAANATLGQAASSRSKLRDQSLQNRKPQRVSAECRQGKHYSCYSLNCICPCNHGGGGRSR